MKIYFKLSGFYFAYFATIGVYIIFLPKVLNDIGYSASEIGVLFALSPLMRFLTPFLFLKYIKLDKKTFKISLFGSVIFVALFYLTIDNFYLFLVNNALLGISFSLILPYVEVIAINYLGSNYGKSRLFGSIGFILISLVVAKFLTHSEIALHYYLISVILVLFFGLSVINFDTFEQSSQTKEKFSILKYPYFWISLFLMQVSFGGFYNFFTIYESKHGISLDIISYLWSFGVICEIIMFYFQNPILKKNLLNIIKVSILLTSFRWFLLYLYPNNLCITFFAQSLHAFSFGLYHSAIVLYLYKIYENKKIAQQFMIGIAYGLGGFSGALISGFLYGEKLFLYCSFVAFFSFLLLFKHKNYNV